MNDLREAITASMALDYSKPCSDMPAIGGIGRYREGFLMSVADVCGVAQDAYWRAKRAHDDATKTNGEKETVYRSAFNELEIALRDGDAVAV